ncbi:MAG: 16S rRNA (uracil(1498)-N(3))-methyltransferase [Clostridiales bacterium]|nr:16S rRNA (uracil(1498)-N(3))-methyltransferase [Clostridiales bacterium]
MPKFFTARENISQDTIIIDNEDVAHITRVLRLGAGDMITVCDGRGFDYEAEISDIEPKRIVCNILSRRSCQSEADIDVTLYQGIPKGTKMEYIIQKTTELGIKRIVPVKLARCVVKLEDKKAEEKKRDRWQKIANEAAKQCGRGVIPKVSMPVTIEEAARELRDADLAFAPYECEENTTLKKTLTSPESPKKIGFIIGPEGGFDISEIELLSKAGIPAVTLGRRILRTETAGEAVLAMVMYELGDINA